MWKKNQVRCTLCQTTHFGRYGAAGILIAKRNPATGQRTHIVMQHRAYTTASGGTWAIPGGARDGSSESAREAALREAGEECGLRADQVAVRGEFVDGNHTGWTYTTVVADLEDGAADFEPRVCDRESLAMQWVPIEEVDAAAASPATSRKVRGQKVLHPAFKVVWPILRGMLSSEEASPTVTEQGKGR